MIRSVIKCSTSKDFKEKGIAVSWSMRLLWIELISFWQIMKILWINILTII